MATSSHCVVPFFSVRHPGFRLFITLLLLLPALSVHAAILTVDCSKKSLQGEISARLDKTAINTLNFSGNCFGNVLLSGHINLTLAGAAAGATITGDAAGGSAVMVEGGTVTMQNFTVDGELSNTGVECTRRAVCVLSNVSVEVGLVRGATGVGAQDQSAIDIVGNAPISGVKAVNGIGIGVFGASSINVRPTWPAGFDPNELGPTISGHDVGVFAQDGSFLRTDNVLIQGNRAGVNAQRNATIKILGSQVGGVTGNTAEGVYVHRASVAQLGSPISFNGYGLFVGPLSFVHDQTGGNITGNTYGDVFCDDSTSVIQGSNSCPPNSRNQRQS